MKFSIILTTKNNKRTIDHCISSIVDQLSIWTELVIVDNFSDDGTYEMMQDFAKKHQNIILFQAWPERHIQRNKWFEASSGEWIYFIDSDMYVW
jgi:glycosyltransferase involved in cell wall biosynthesis